MTAPLVFLMGWLRRRHCLHHDVHTGESWVHTFLVDLGRAKHTKCSRCGQYWTRW